MNKRFRLDFLMLTVLCLVSAAILYSCKSEPSDLGLNFVDPNDTTGTYILDSQTDTMTITGNNYKKAVSTFASPYMLIGNSGDYTSKSFLIFNDAFTEYDSSSVSSAILYLRYANYAYTDSNAPISFNIYRITRQINFQTVTRDSINPSDIGTKLLGTYTGNPVDSALISITLDNNLIRDWLEYFADTNYAVKNYGIAIVPNISSSTIKGFYSSQTTLSPYVTTIVTKNGETDTLTFDDSYSVWFSDAPASLLTPDRFTLQNGIGFFELMGFDLSKLPANVIINEALITLTLDTNNSYISSLADRRLSIGLTSDSVNKTDTSVGDVTTLTPVQGVYEFRLNTFFQYWNNGTYPNLGIIISNIYPFENLDRYVFYGPGYSDPTKVPRLRIRYTPRLP